MIALRRLRRASHVACVEKMRNTYKILVVRHEGYGTIGILGVDGRIILNCRFSTLYSSI
jgi:hypothetical protein